MNPTPSVLELILCIVAVVLGTALGIYLLYIMLYFFMLPWFIMIHIFSLGSIPMPDLELNPFKRKKK